MDATILKMSSASSVVCLQWSLHPARCTCMVGSRGGLGVRTPPPPVKNSKNIAFLSYTGPDPPYHKATKPAFNFGPLSSVHNVQIQRGGGGGGGRGPDPPPPLKNHKNIGFLRNTGPDPLKNHNPAIIQFWAIIGTPEKRHLKWCFAGGLMIAGSLVVVFGSSLPSTTNKKQKSQGCWTPSDKTFWIHAWHVLNYSFTYRWHHGVHVYIYIYRDLYSVMKCHI